MKNKICVFHLIFQEDSLTNLLLTICEIFWQILWQKTHISSVIHKHFLFQMFLWLERVGTSPTSKNQVRNYFFKQTYHLIFSRHLILPLTTKKSVWPRVSYYHRLFSLLYHILSNWPQWRCYDDFRRYAKFCKTVLLKQILPFRWDSCF